MKRFAQRLARLERQRPSVVQADNEWRGIPMRELIGFMTFGERSEFRELLIAAKDHFRDLTEPERNIVREGMRDILDVAADRIEAGEAPPVERRPSMQEAYEASRRSAMPE